MKTTFDKLKAGDHFRRNGMEEVLVRIAGAEGRAVDCNTGALLYPTADVPVESFDVEIYECLG